ncbi:glycosyltransferase family 4 protein [Bradyrhizobium sp. WYCCWR 13023]|uniref:Glycosyltransferase family 4 protein n=1 Tax=Bradyrhizobium zhengyangense TaxID=2911009 RepID=A0A9X1RH96_9BRAD|nr:MULTISPECIES: glycosyltransferase family 1 protein [Bradyrhizobium]MCG2631535.1 glycosyltransferase family 4 protein [Bradyrhizobium zhengyangense]MCG2671395.1 glycosyltransferase family 4 protein [Bradyrhizobium zhengyangense]MDA9522834.1 glycosyl transferase [Bradyrhizobium sp. CCBAU 11434]
MKLSINGRFLSQSLTGVQRYAAEIVKAMDRLLASGNAPSPLLDADWQILAPPNAQTLGGLCRIKIKRVGSLQGHAWDQLDLARAAAGTRLVSLANSGPVLHRDHLVVIHDAQVFKRPDFFSWRYLALHRSLGHLLARTATIATVSTFSRNELADALSLDPGSIPIIPNSAEHFASIEPDFSIIESLRLEPYRFFLFVGSMTKNKNVDTAIRAAERLGRADFPLVVVGGDNSKVFGGGVTKSSAGFIVAGRLKDEEVAALFARAAAFVFPSLYEGFGIPPLEAMYFACPVIASSAAAIRETCGDAAVYFDPLNPDELSARMRERIDLGRISAAEQQKQQGRLATYSWTKSAAAILEVLAQSTPRAISGGSAR